MTNLPAGRQETNPVLILHSDSAHGTGEYS